MIELADQVIVKTAVLQKSNVKCIRIKCEVDGFIYEGMLRRE